VKIIAHPLAILKGHQGAIYALQKGPEPGMIFSAGADKVVSAWNLQTKENHPFLARFPSPVYSLCYIPERNLLIAGTSSGAIHLIDLDKKTELKILRHHTAQIFDIRYSILNNSFYTLGGDGNMGVCSLDSLSLTQLIKLSSAKLRQMDLNSEETELVVACGEGDLIILNTSTLREEKRFHAHDFSANSVKYHPNGTTLISGGKDALLKVWDRKNEFANLHTIPAHNYAIYSIDFSPDARFFATASRDKTVKIWDATTYQFLLRLDKDTHRGHVNSVNTLMWSQNPLCLVSAGDDRSLIVWEIEQ
jgi:WD repeat-containing protein 61